MIKNQPINQLTSMYPSMGFMLTPDNNFDFQDEYHWGSMYGYSFGKATLSHDQKTYDLSQGQYFSIFIQDKKPVFKCQDPVFLVVRLGFRCQNIMGWCESQGRLSYIDGCSDSLLIYPPRMGDPSLNLLYFPCGIEQTKHLHPSIRIGCVIDGAGISDIWHKGTVVQEALNLGDWFCLEENELHRFRTLDHSMTVIAWHPDGDWGPTDKNHTMLNRTYINC